MNLPQHRKTATLLHAVITFALQIYRNTKEVVYEI